jgi:hypothetical protein
MYKIKIIMDNSAVSVKDEKANKIVQLVEEFDSKEQMDKDNKNMLGKIAETDTFSEAIKTLMKDPENGRELSYFESRMRFG